ncbi:Carboxylesterase, type B [Akanthomyces lecanii RCEF 1005]|uniref:Carboxylic ester hydrolase n=1 Tax=Akanthomyces lecanii RCEF 1005 TaxID=1081108 RepID=A0A168CQS1_CORDF|nr:Carboxylesterase, type B [Akanthomyces lecanii RCEF 1005]
MKPAVSFLCILLYGCQLSCALPGATKDDRAATEERSNTVKVTFRGGSVIGRSRLGTEAFTAIPYAEPPVGDFRLRPPQQFTGTLKDHDGTGLSPSCPQHYVDTDAMDLISSVASGILKLPFFDRLTGQEDCLTLTVQRPTGTKPGDGLPILFWIYGGAFVLGGTNTYDATSFLARAVDQGQPFIMVSVNYRLNGFGFMGGREVLEAGVSNLGLLDQRLGLQWVADNIADFGGDPDKVTIWGESAGSISVFDQMLLFGGNATYKGKPLFRGAIMDSGSVLPTEPVDCQQEQELFDETVRSAGCSGVADTLHCLRQLPYEKFYNAVTSVPGIASINHLQWSHIPRPDGKVLVESPDVMAAKGNFHAVPLIIGNQEDEGSVFAIITPNLTSTDRIVNYLSEYVLHNTSREVIQQFVDMYPTSPAAGSPFRTGFLNELYPGFKRMSALIGDAILHFPRRYVLETVSRVKPDTPMWSYLASYDYGLPFVGTFHGSDILQTFYGVPPNHAEKSSRTYYLNFIHNLDPNKGVENYDNWPRWTESEKLMWLKTPYNNDLLDDDFRKDRSDFFNQNIASLRY